MARKKPEPPKKSKKSKKSPEQVCAEKIRYHKALDSRWAILEEARVEYFRGKDFVELVQKHPDVVAALVPPEEASQLSEPVEVVVADILLAAKLIVRCDRVVKTIRPGRKKLSKWPARLEFHPSQRFVVEEGFYAWTFEGAQPIWQTILTILFPIFIVGCCLFPVFPYRFKLIVLYFLLSLIALILGLLFVRWVVYGVIWIATGKRVWFFPRILQEEASLAELFRFWPDKDEEPPVKVTTRLAMASMVGFTLWLMVRYAPDQDTRSRYQKRVTNIIDDFVTWSPAMLAGKTAAQTNATADAANATAAAAGAANSSAAADASTASASSKAASDLPPLVNETSEEGASSSSSPSASTESRRTEGVSGNGEASSPPGSEGGGDSDVSGAEKSSTSESNGGSLHSSASERDGEL